MPNIEDHIRKAIEDGQFSDLPGKGKPLHLDENPHANPEWRMAYHALKNSGFSLPWIEKRQEILEALENQRQTLKRVWNWSQSSANPKLAQEEWQRAVTEFRSQMGKVDLKIRDFNLEAPHERFQLLRLNVEKEIADISRQ
jgi:DnaJ homolog subfamily C member 28